MQLIVVVTFFVVFGWLGVVAWCDVMNPARLHVAVGGGRTLLASVRSIVVLDDEVLVELSPEPGRAASRFPRWFTTSGAVNGSFLQRWRDQHRAVEVIGDTAAPTLRRGDEVVKLSMLPEAADSAFD